VDTIKSGITVDSTTSQWHRGFRSLGIWSKGDAFWSMTCCSLMRWHVLKLGEEGLIEVIAKTNMKCGCLSLFLVRAFCPSCFAF
jgi:hypothetical protein